MKFISRFAAHLLLLSLAAAITVPVFASDFSKLAEPPFARYLLMDAKQHRQAECAGLATYRAERGETPGKKAARRLSGEIVRRFAIALGDEALAREIIEGKAAGYADPTKTEPLWAEVRREMTRQCEPMFAASLKGEVELAAALGPPPAGPLELPSAEQCLAVADYVRESGVADWDEESGKLLRRDRFENANAEERARREAIVEGGLKVLRDKKPDAQQAELMMITCLPTIAEAAKRLGPDISDQLER